MAEKKLIRGKYLRIVLPGDEIPEVAEQCSKLRTFLGPGLKRNQNTVLATRPGLLRIEGTSLYYVETIQKRYIPRKREFVIGTVTKKKGDTYFIDIGSHEQAIISYLAFENSSKKNRKELKVGDLVYGQLLQAGKHLESEMVCIDIYNKSVGMGSLPEYGTLFTVPLNIARQIVDPQNPFLLQIAKRVQYSIVVGFNGRVFINAKSNIDKVAVMQAIYLLECSGLESAMKELDQLLNTFLS